MINKRQAVAIWVFGVAVALLLLLAGYYILGLAVIGGLVVFGLQSKDKSANSGRSIPARNKTQVESSLIESSNTGLTDMTPHMFASAHVKLMFANDPPFNMWRPDPGVIPENADAVCELYSRAFQLKILLDLIIRKFGEPIAMLVEASFRTLLDESMYKDPAKWFGTAFDKIDEARSLGPVPYEDIPLDEGLRLDVRVADQILNIFDEKDRQKMRLPLANCLSNARLAAEALFPDLVAKTEFAPSSIVSVERRDFYAGKTCRWSRYPGSFERHLQRREGNPIFPEGTRNPANEEIKAAREKDAVDFKTAEDTALEWLKGVAELVGPAGSEKVMVREMSDYHKASSDVMAACAEAGGRAEVYLNKVRSVDETIAVETVNAIEKSSPEDAEILRGADAVWVAMRAVLTQPFAAQYSRKDGPIKSTEVVAALLCESVQTVQEIVDFTNDVLPEDMKAWYRKEIMDWYPQALVLADRAKRAKFDLPAIERKLAILGSVGQAPPPAEYVDLATLREDLISKSDDPEEYQKSTEPLLQELKRKFGDRIPVDQVQQFILGKKLTLKAQMRSMVAKAADKGGTISVESLRENMEKKKEEYKGEDRETFNREIDKFIQSLKAQYGDQIPIAEAFKLVQKLERATGETDTINQP